MPRKSLILAGLGLSAVVPLVVAGPAQASDSYHKAYTVESDSIGTAKQGGVVYFKEHDDLVSVCDNDTDGYSAELDVYVGNTLRYHLSDGGDDGICDNAAGYWGGAYNLPEHTNIKFVTYLYDGDTGKFTGGVSHTWYNDN